MKIIFFLSLFLKSFLFCDPINVYTNLFPNIITETKYINKGIRIGFISKTKCSGSLLSVQGEQDTDFWTDSKIITELVSITVSKFILDGTYQIFYSYQVLLQMDVVKKLNFTNFQYRLQYNKQQGKFLNQKIFQFKSKFNYDEQSQFKIAIIGNLKIDYIQKFIKVWQEREIDCLIHLGNFQEDWYRDGGEGFNKYFNLLEPLISKIPFYFIKGAYEKPGDFNGPLNNRFLQTFPSNQIDNYFSSLQYGKLNFNFFNLSILRQIPQRNVVMNYIKKNINNTISDSSNQISLFSNYSINCINKDKYETCSDNNPFSIRQFELYLSQIKLRLLVSAGYPVYQYFKVYSFQSQHNYLSNYWDSQNYNPINFLVGTGGYAKNHDPDFSQSYKDEKMNITNLTNELGYLEMYFESLTFEQFRTSFISIQQNDEIIEKDVRDSKYNNFFNLMGKGIKGNLAKALKAKYQKLAEQKVEQFEQISNEEEITSQSQESSQAEIQKMIAEKLNENQKQNEQSKSTQIIEDSDSSLIKNKIKI